MVEFGEKVKKLREEMGMTQQSLAEKLYVTRQAVSRWEHGARYPDLLTAKKIAAILKVSLDELVSGEELRDNIEKEPILAQPVENIVQTVLYAVAALVYLLLSMFSLYSYIRPNEALVGTPAGEITLIKLASDGVRIVYLAAVVYGGILSAKNKLTAKITGGVMCVPYVAASIEFLVTYIDMQIKQNGYMDMSGWMMEFLIPAALGVVIVVFFARRERRIPVQIIYGASILTIGYLVYGYKSRFMSLTDLGFAVTTVHMAGKIGMACLLGYQAYVWDRKKRIAYGGE